VIPEFTEFPRILSHGRRLPSAVATFSDMAPRFVFKRPRAAYASSASRMWDGLGPLHAKTRGATRPWQRLPSTGKLLPAVIKLPIQPASVDLAAPFLPVSRVHPEGDVIKFCQRTHDGLETESVIIPMGARENTWRTLCVSSQVGCARGCTFCQTAQMGLLRHLTLEEILGQVRAARLHFGADIRNVVFMGMGEPMDNLDAVIAAIIALHEDRDHQIPRRRITVSTVGRCDGIRRLGSYGWRRLNLAVSLNAPNDAIRSQIMPINRTEPMARLREAIAAFPVRAGGHVLIEYVAIAGLNDQPEHALELVEYLRGLPTVVNLIPYNPRQGSDFEVPTEETLVAFQALVMARGQLIFRRNTKGRSVMAACGQLGNVEKRSSSRQ